MLEPLYQYLHTKADLSSEDFRLLEPFLEIRHFSKGIKLTEVNEVEGYLNFIVTGLARKFFYRQEQEVTTQIAAESDIICEASSFIHGTPSKYVIEALEPTTVISISAANMEKVYAINSKMDRMGKMVVIDWLFQRENWDIDFIVLTPKERFTKFVTENPYLLKRVPQKYLASYLNIAPETFSRFKRLTNQG